MIYVIVRILNYFHIKWLPIIQISTKAVEKPISYMCGDALMKIIVPAGHAGIQLHCE